MSRIELETPIDAPPERCFDISRSIELHLEAAADRSERAIDGVTSGLLGEGDTVTWEARHREQDTRASQSRHAIYAR